MLLTFTELVSNNPIAINPEHLIGVFNVIEGEHAGNTAISLSNGSLIVSENYLDVVGRINGALA